MTLFSLSDASISYPGKPPFTHIDFTLCKSQHVALTGPNHGLIKALLDALAGKALISGGYFNGIQADGRLCESGTAVSYLPAHFRFRSFSGDAGYYQQRYNSMDAGNSSTVRDYLATISLKSQIAAAQAETFLKSLDVEKLMETRLTSLSNGETKKVRLSAALMHQPKLLVLEDPFAGIDAHTRVTLSECLDQIAESGVTLVLSTYREMPACIRKVVVAGMDHSLNSYDRRNFSFAQAGFRPMPDRTLLAGLLESPHKTFETIVQMRNVSVRYQQRDILQNINWTVKQGERWAITGPNGAGKSTLFSLINGDNPQAFANNLILFDRKKGSGESIWDIKNHIGYFSADMVRFFPGRFTAEQIVASGFFDTFGLFRRTSERQRKIAEGWLRLCNLLPLARKPFAQLASNEKRMILLCRALVKNPSLLILDEPTQGITETEKVFLIGLVNEICAHTPATLLYSSHYQQEMPSCINRHLKLRDGKIVHIQ